MITHVEMILVAMHTDKCDDFARTIQMLHPEGCFASGNYFLLGMCTYKE